MELNEIKKALYKEKPMALQTYRGNDYIRYVANTSLGKIVFTVPYKDQLREDGTYIPEFENNEIPAQLLIRWIVKE